MDSLRGKIALVTGSSRGIGRAAALQMASCGAKVLFHGASESANLFSAVQEAGNGAEALTADFSDGDAVKALAEDLLQRALIPDILVLNASVQNYSGMENFEQNDFRWIFQSNVESSCILLRMLLPAMQAKRNGRIIFVGSINGIRPAPRLAIYGASKAALQNIAQSAAKICAPFGITVNTILPGVIETDRNAKALQDPQTVAFLKEHIPMGRFGNAAECGNLITFLASDAAAYITGAEIPIAGGMQL